METSVARPEIDHYMMGMAVLASSRATCARRSVGCVLTNGLNHVVATGYNGVPRGMVHCTDHPCLGAGSPSGTNLEGCMANHAEQNALLQCRNVEEVVKCYSTTAPCITCTKLLLNTGCKEIVFLEQYPHSKSQRIWELAGRSWIGMNSLDRSAIAGMFGHILTVRLANPQER